MGECYSVEFKAKLRDKAGAVQALKAHIANDTRTNYSLEKHAQRGVFTDTFDDLMRIFLTGWPRHELYSITKSGDFVTYESDFNATYSWESVMLDMLNVLVPFLDDGSKLVISVGNDYDELIIQNGACIQLH